MHAVVSVSLFPTASDAQEVRGEVLDKVRRPVAGAYIGLFDEDRNLVAAGFADEKGDFSITAPEEGTYFVLMSRIGYRSLYDGPFELVDDGALRLFAVMHPFPLAIDGLEIEVDGAVARLVEVGFYERRARGFGYFLERDELGDHAGGTLTEWFRRIPVVDVIESVSSRLPGERALVMSRNGRSCEPTLYVDGRLTGHGGEGPPPPISPYEPWVPGDLQAVEVYTTISGRPIEFQVVGSCGLVLLWTRDSSLRRADR